CDQRLAESAIAELGVVADIPQRAACRALERDARGHEVVLGGRHRDVGAGHCGGGTREVQRDVLWVVRELGVVGEGSERGPSAPPAHEAPRPSLARSLSTFSSGIARLPPEAWDWVYASNVVRDIR